MKRFTGIIVFILVVLIVGISMMLAASAVDAAKQIEKKHDSYEGLFNN